MGFRWRIEREVYSGKGQFICANKTCENTEKLVSYEVNFSYFEHNVSKNALVKCRLCPDCSAKLNYRRQMKKAKRKRKHRDRSPQRKPSSSSSSSSSSSEDHETEAGQAAEAKAQQDEEAQKIWQKPLELEKTKEEEFDEYFADMFQ